VRIPLITDIQHFSLQDGPGIRTTIFVKGCPLRCQWCHNPETQKPQQEMFYYSNRCVSCGRCAAICPGQASSLVKAAGKAAHLEVDRSKCLNCLRCTTTCLSNARGAAGQHLSMEAILREALADKLFFANSGGGVTLSGGDPLMYPEFVVELSRRLRAEGVHVAVETSCFPKQWTTVVPLLEHIGLFIVDLKSLDPGKHAEFTGWPLQPILTNLNHLFESDVAIRIHLPIVPGFNDSPEDFAAYADFLARHADRLDGVDILAFHAYGEGKYNALGRKDTYKFKGVEENPPEHVVPLARALKDRGVRNITVGGMVGVVRKKRTQHELAS